MKHGIRLRAGWRAVACHAFVQHNHLSHITLRVVQLGSYLVGAGLAGAELLGVGFGRDGAAHGAVAGGGAFLVRREEGGGVEAGPEAVLLDGDRGDVVEVDVEAEGAGVGGGEPAVQRADDALGEGQDGGAPEGAVAPCLRCTVALRFTLRRARGGSWRRCCRRDCRRGVRTCCGLIGGTRDTPLCLHQRLDRPSSRPSPAQRRSLHY